MEQDKNELNRMCRHLWLRGALDKPEEFGRVRNLLMEKCLAHATRMEFRELLLLTQAMHWVGPFCREEPYVSMYEQAIGKLGALAAYSASQLHDFDTAYIELAAVRALMKTSNIRREKLGFVPWPFSELKLHMITVLADCKAQGAEADRDRLYTPDELNELYELAYERVTAFMEEHQVGGNEARINWRNLSRASFQLLKLSARFTPQFQIDRIQRFNRRFGANIAMGVGHFRNSRALGGRWYWDYEITKLLLAGELTMPELDFCQERLLKAAMAEDPEATIFHQALRIEYFWLAKAIRRRDKPGLEVISG